jgi:hypothetical protein
MNLSIPLSNALQALPLEAPSESLWPTLHAQLPKKPIWPKWAMASAASVALVLLSLTFNANVPWSMLSNDGQQHVKQNTLEQLILQSAQLENSFYTQQDDSISSATVIAANLAIEDQLNTIDNQLSAQPSNSAIVSLWQQRINLLNQGLSLNKTNAQFNASGQNLDLALASIN